MNKKVWHRRAMGGLVSALLLLGLALPAGASDYTRTRYPVVLVHGLFGFDALGGVYDYWYGIPGALREGGATVYVANMSSSNSNEVRGEQLIDYMETLRATYGYTKFNLVGHSHGGPTARYVAAVAPQLVASVTTMGSPHTGSAVADAVRADVAPGSWTESVVSSMVNAFATMIEWLSGDSDPQDSLAALASLNTEGAAAFNSKYPQAMPTTACGQGAASVNGVRYYSMGGTSTLTNLFDVSDAGLGFGGLLFGGEANDGLVGRCSSHLGVVLRDDYGWNHLDEVNQIIGLRGVFASDPEGVYRAHANRLKYAGL